MNGEIALCQVLMRDVLIIPWREGSLFADRVRAVGNIDFAGIDGHARISDRCEYAAPVRIASCPCSLDQRGMGNGAGDAQCICIRERASDVELDHVLNAFSVFDDLLRQSNPELGSSAAVTIDHVIQSIYLSAVVAMGAATEPGQKPRIDIIGARQSIDMLSVLQEKTRGNLTEKEQRLLQNILFELRMMFLEITNAISQSAQHPPMGKK